MSFIIKSSNCIIFLLIEDNGGLVTKLVLKLRFQSFYPNEVIFLFFYFLAGFFVHATVHKLQIMHKILI